MILATTATEIELRPFLKKWNTLQGSTLSRAGVETLVTGVGPTDTALSLTKALAEKGGEITSVVSFGIGGAYIQPDENDQPQLLDICIAAKEIFGDLGVCLGDEIEYLDSALTGSLSCELDREMALRAKTILDGAGFRAYYGNFITVSGATGRRSRGEYLQKTWNGLCENMEGAAMARVCRVFSIPCLEVRAVSNYVDDRDTSSWKLGEACEKAGAAAYYLIDELRDYAEKR